MTGHFVYRLIPPRPTFDLDMTDDERAVMGRHAEYWQGLMAAGKVLIYGPVRDDTGAWGLGVLQVGNEQEARELVSGDPAVSTGMATAELGPMVQAILRQ